MNGPREVVRSVDAMIEAYVDWREEQSTVWTAYRRWSGARAAEAGLAFAAYQAALDRERQAADAYARSTHRVTDLVRTRRRPRERPVTGAAPPLREETDDGTG
jgi:hypothetical protein